MDRCATLAVTDQPATGVGAARATTAALGWVPPGVGASPRSLLMGALVSLALGAAVFEGVAGERASLSSATSAGHSQQRGLAALPPAAQGPVSAALGADDPAYWVRASAGRLQAVGPAQRLRVGFKRSGPMLGTGSLQLGLSLRSIGYGGSLRAVDRVAPRVSANRVTYAHDGLSEWYINGPAGLEQGFILARPPSPGASRSLTLSIALSGDVRGARSADGRGISFSRGGTSLSYGGLVASDALGRTLPSSLALRAGMIGLGVDTRGARYPLRIDPLIQQGAKLTGGPEEKGTESGGFGISVALSADGNTALAGASNDSNHVGAAWVFTRQGSIWTQQGKKLTGAEEVGGTGGGGCEGGEECAEGPGGHFGGSVALSGDGNTALIGGADDNGSIGAAWVFTRAGETWTQQGPKLTGIDERGQGRFARSAALSGDGNTALIGGSRDAGGKGAAWVFARSGESWTQQGSKLILTGAQEQGEGFFGRSVALSSDGQTALIGAPGVGAYLGGAWVFARSGASWKQAGGELTGAEETGAAHFGRSVAVSSDGQTALIGGFADSNRVGAAWGFARSGSTWTQQGAKLTAGDETGEGWFGYELALSGDGNRALIGGPYDTRKVGAAWMFMRSGPGWTQQGQKLLGGEEVGVGGFGYDVALSGDGNTGLAGGPYDARKIGAAWAFNELVEPEEPPEKEKGREVMPVVKEVSPAEGPSSGGTSVTITGGHFANAGAVYFGSAPAVGFTVNSASSITAVSPAEPAGTVDVRVTTPAGTSNQNVHDHFSFLAAPAGPGPGDGGSSGQGGGGGVGGGGVLGFGPIASAARPSCTISLLSKRIAVNGRGLAALKLSWAGTGVCSGMLTLKVRQRAASKRSGGRGPARTKTIGTGSFSVLAGAVGVLNVKLNAAGRALLRAAHAGLNASVLILKQSPGPAQAQTASVRLRQGQSRSTKTRKR